MAKKAAAAKVEAKADDIVPGSEQTPGNVIPELIQRIHTAPNEDAEEPEAEDADEPEAEAAPEPEAPKGKRGLAEKLKERDLENERLKSENAAILTRLDGLQKAVESLKNPAAPPEAIPDFDNMDATEREAYIQKREAKVRDEVKGEATAAELRSLYKVERRLHPDYDKVVNKWSAFMEADPDLVKELRASDNPFATAYDIAAELEEAEKARDSGEEEDQVTAREQLRGPRSVPERARAPGEQRTSVAGEAADLERMFGKTIDREKFSKHRKFGDQLRAARRKGR